MKLTSKVLKRLVREEIQKEKLFELYSIGLNASKPSIQKFPKSLEREELPDSPAPSIEIDNIEEDIPLAADPTVPESAQVSITMNLGETEEWMHFKEVEKRVKQFQKWWRSIETNARYSVELWLRQELVKRLNPQEIQQLVAQHTAAAKGYTGAVDKNKKPS